MAPHEHNKCTCSESSQIEDGLTWLFEAIHLEGVSCLNEELVGSCSKILTPHDKRFEQTEICTSLERDIEDGEEFSELVNHHGSIDSLFS